MDFCTQGQYKINTLFRHKVKLSSHKNFKVVDFMPMGKIALYYGFIGPKGNIKIQDSFLDLR